MLSYLIIIDHYTQLPQRLSKLIKIQRRVSHIARLLKHFYDLLLIQLDSEILRENQKFAQVYLRPLLHDLIKLHPLRKMLHRIERKDLSQPLLSRLNHIRINSYRAQSMRGARDDRLHLHLRPLLLSHLVDLVQLSSQVLDDGKNGLFLGFVLELVLVVELLVLLEGFFDSFSEGVVVGVGFLFEVLVEDFVEFFLVVEEEDFGGVFVEALEVGYELFGS